MCFEHYICWRDTQSTPVFCLFLHFYFWFFSQRCFFNLCPDSILFPSSYPSQETWISLHGPNWYSSIPSMKGEVFSFSVGKSLSRVSIILNQHCNGCRGCQSHACQWLCRRVQWNMFWSVLQEKAMMVFVFDFHLSLWVSRAPDARQLHGTFGSCGKWALYFCTLLNGLHHVWLSIPWEEGQGGWSLPCSQGPPKWFWLEGDGKLLWGVK